VPEADGRPEGASRFADAVIVAAGASTRMGGSDKTAATIIGRSMLAWSVAATARATAVDRVVVVTSPDRVAALSAELAGATVVAGGEQRSDSVRLGLAATSAEVVLVHDAARPLASSELADAVAIAARQHGAAIPVIPVSDSLKREGASSLSSVDRTGLFRAQTPQGARRELLIEAFAKSGGQSFTDEAALLESLGVEVAKVPGEAANIKVTEPADLELVRAIAAGRNEAQTRIGLGQDSHGFGTEVGLKLGGITVDGAPRLHGHSDGDVVLHALATAVISAAGRGDLGRLFPPSDARTRGIDSAELVAEALRQAMQAGWSVESVQISLTGARPRLGAGRIDAISERVAQLLGVGNEAVSIVASTGNLVGAEGAGRAISATCLVVAHRR
jgi:2-C-methyl-D-erythritol 4-phosphate cytidylyltransferase/2-C-methyl-D-erythritol 2,4-cyclodiphosphate synthase